MHDPASSSAPAVATSAPASAPAVLSVIDVGSSGVRMLVAELKADGAVRLLEDVQKPLALGRETFRTGTLSAASIQKAVNILRQYRAMMDSYGVTHTRAVATSAVRGALNRDTFVDRVFLATGIEVEVIEGSQETPLTFEKVGNLIAIGPEARFAARALKGEGELAAVSAKDLRSLADQILGMTPAEAAASFSISTSEAEALAPAFLAYAELIRLNPVDRLLVASAGIRYRLLFQFAKSIQTGPSPL